MAHLLHRRSLAVVAAASLASVASGGLLFGLVSPPDASDPSWLGQVILPNATLQRKSTAPYNLYSPAQFVGLQADGRTLVAAVANLTARGGLGAMDLVSLDILTGSVSARVPSPLAVQGGLGLNQFLAVMSDSNDVALLGANTTAPGADLRLYAVSPSTGAAREFPAAALNGSAYYGSWPGVSAYSTKSHTLLAHVRSYAQPAVPAWHFFDMLDGSVIVRRGCWVNSLSYDVASDTFVGLEVTHNGTTINDTYVRVSRTPADGSADCAPGAGPVVFDEGTVPWALVETVQAYDSEPGLLYAYGEPVPGYAGPAPPLPGAVLLVVNATDGSVVALDASLTPAADSLVVTGMCGGGGGRGGGGGCA